ncbi:UNVERIFIED_CONTAM: hypothetical protein Slati_2121000 [Sesamum latifolium]|uniref:RNase H type-1 domain-containing protein n=1 Tax=Sesamum latifolium TaxID=2727402 RepID=A0AAW2WR46_9LAMI
MGVIKLNFDGAILDRGSAMGIGVVARDEYGSCIAWISHSLNKVRHGELAEAWAAVEAIQLATRQG